MEYVVVTADRCFREACYDNWSDLIRDWEAEIRAGTHRIWVFGSEYGEKNGKQLQTPDA